MTLLKFPINMFYQHQGITVVQWRKLRQALGKNTECRVIKKAQGVYEFGNNPILYGASCVISFESLDDISKVILITQKFNDNLINVGGYWDNKFWTHQDIIMFKNLESKELLWCKLIMSLEYNHNIRKVLKSSQKNFNNLLNYSNYQLSRLL